MVKNVIMFTFWRRKSVLSVVKLCFLVLWILQTLHYTPRNHLVVKKDVKKILDGFKMEYWPSKDKKHQNILPFQELWNSKKCYYVYVLKAQIISKRREALLFGSMDSSDIALHPTKQFGSEKRCQKFLDGFKIEHWPSKDKKHQSSWNGRIFWCFLFFEGQCSILKPSKICLTSFFTTKWFRGV